MASLIAAGEVFSGSALEGRSAVYLGPTPWKATCPAFALLRSLHRAGPVDSPWFGLVVWCGVVEGRENVCTYKKAGLGGCTRKDEGDGLAGAIAEFVSAGDFGVLVWGAILEDISSELEGMYAVALAGQWE